MGICSTGAGDGAVPRAKGFWQRSLGSMLLKLAANSKQRCQGRKFVLVVKEIAQAVASIAGCGASIAIKLDPVVAVLEVYSKVGCGGRETLDRADEHVLLKDMLDGL
jgi:hypothetical protein